MSRFHSRLSVWLRDHGYRYSDRRLYSKRVAGFPERSVGRVFRDIVDACEWLIPIVGDAAGYNLACDMSDRVGAVLTAIENRRKGKV